RPLGNSQLLVQLAKGGVQGGGVPRVTNSPGERDLAGVPAEVGRAKGEEQTRGFFPDDEGSHHRRVAQLEAGQGRLPSRMLLELLGELDEPRVHQGRPTSRAADAGGTREGVWSSPASGRSRPAWRSTSSSPPSASRYTTKTSVVRVRR